MLTPKQLKSMSSRELRLAMAKRDAVIVQYQRESKQLKREIERRTPREVHFRVRTSASRPSTRPRAGILGMRRRIYPRPPQNQTRYPVDLCADEIEAWMVREGITHVVSESEDTETSPESLARGHYRRAQFISWWRLLEKDD